MPQTVCEQTVCEHTFCASESGSSAWDGSELADAVATLDTKSLTVSHKTLRNKKQENNYGFKGAVSPFLVLL